MSVLVEAPKKDVEPGRSLDDILNGKIDHNIANASLDLWDRGVFQNELQKQGIVFTSSPAGAIDNGLVADTGLSKGTYNGTRMALTEYYSLLEQSAVSYMDSNRIEPIIPIKRDLKLKEDLYKWSNPADDGYPPHLAILPPDEAAGAQWIFDKNKLGDVSSLAKALAFLIPKEIAPMGTPFEGPKIADCENYNRTHPGPPTDIMLGQNLGNLSDWYSDARFAQQHLSGVNPMTIEKAPAEKVKAYAEEAGKQGLNDMKQLLSEGKDLLIQDYSFFREATGVSNEEIFQNIIPEINEQMKPTGKAALRYACASVAIFQLHEDGRLHPLAITLDYRGSLDKSITIFNRRLTPDAKGAVDEKDDWPWRYAKTCVQTADWARHEIAVHLVNTHMIEEAIIVATNRTIPEGDLLYEILSPHWYRTLALNAAARKTLVPFVVARLAGLGPSWNPDPTQTKNNRAYKMVGWCFKNFNFQDNYVPVDLKKRGFDLEAEQGEKYRNYPYATSMAMLWEVLRGFVKAVIETKYKTDKDIEDESYIAKWCTEIQTSGQIPTFPTIKTVDQLIDAVTMCIHIASPQHTAVNYLQNYYYNFIPAKPAALCTPLPKDLKTLQGYTEAELTAALPIGTDNTKWKDWLLAAQLPELLSFKVDAKYTLLTYAKSLYNVNKDRTILENSKFDCKAIAAAAAKFYSQLKDLELAFDFISQCQTPGTVQYKVLQPELTAVSILI